MEDNYYERGRATAREGSSDRYPRNHVRYSRLLAPLELLNRAHVRFGRGPLSLREALLGEYDAAAPLDARLGTSEDLASLRRVIDAYGKGIDENPHLSGIGRALLKKFGKDFLRIRRQVLAHYEAHSTFIEARGRVKAPIIITGLPRTGSTLLQRLLSEDPNTRSPRTYEMEAPLPPLEEGDDPLGDPRIAASGNATNLLRRLAPGFFEKYDESHRVDPKEFEESFIYMLFHNGVNVMNAAQAGHEYLREYLAVENKRPALRYERLFFTMLDAHRPAPSHWTLKAPVYAMAFPLVFEEYPDVRMVVTHRNPLIVLPSVCRLMESWNIAFDQDGVFDKYRFAELTVRVMEVLATGPLRFREEHPEKERQIFDCMYEELFADPVGMVRRIYAHFDLEVTPTFEARMQTYLENNRQGKYGRHRYSLEEYGIDPEEYLDRHRDYMEHYGFDIEGARGPRRTSLGLAS